jgi:hypothetical protein
MTKARTLADNFAADINGITAGTGITGGGTSGTVTVTNSMATEIDAKGDLVVGTGADTFSRLAVASTAGYLLSVDSGETTGLKWAAPASSGVNKNYLINGGFAIAQRGTSFTSTGSANNDDAYTLDRWYILSDTNDVIDVTQETSTVPTNGQFAIALDVETVDKKFGIATIIENKDCVGLIGNTVTFSFKAKVSATTKLDNVKAAIVAWSGTADTVTSDIISAWGAEGTNPTLIANATYENSPANLNLTTSYATYSVSAAVDTASTKNLVLFIWSDVTDTTLGDFLYIAESKLELGSSATAFQYAGGTIEGELTACQRYYYRISRVASATLDVGFGVGSSNSETTPKGLVTFPVTMRIIPTTLDFSGISCTDAGNSGTLVVTAITTLGTTNAAYLSGTSADNLVVYTRVYFWGFYNTTTTKYIGWSAEL